MHWCYFQCLRVLFLLIFLPHIVRQCHLWQVKPNVSSWVFMFSDPFVELIPITSTRIISSVLQGGYHRYLSLWWYFCNVVWFWVVFSFSWDIFFQNYFFHLSLFNGDRFQYSQILVNFLFSSVLIFPWFGSSIPSCVVFHYSLLAWHIFLRQITSLYPDYIFLSSVPGCPILFHFWQIVWCRPCAWGDSSLQVLFKFVDAPVHFLSMWLRGIIAIINCNGDRASPLKIPLWIFTSSKLFLLQSFSLSSLSWFSR